MIRYNLICGNEHDFDSWFKDSKSYNIQEKSNSILCPICNSNNISKALMSPGIPKKTNSLKKDKLLDDNNSRVMRDTLRKLRKEIKKNADYVGTDFPNEARKIFYKESKDRSIYGEATQDDVRGLIEEGIDIIPLPEMPDDKN
jgi:hypothetical protein